MTTTMHFGPEWMRTKGSARPAPEPPLTSAPAGTSTYSALVAPTTNGPPERRDDPNPFRYSKDEILRIYKEGGGRGGLGLEVERWEGIVREVGCEPVGLKEMSESEKKLFAGSLNSEIRRRQSTDVLSPLTTTLGERTKLGHAATAGSPMRERIGNLTSRRRDSTDQQPLGIPRKLSLSSIQIGTFAPPPRETPLPSPRTRVGGTPGFEGVLGESWSSRRRGDSLSKTGGDTVGRRDREGTDSGRDLKGPDIKEEDEDMARKADQDGPARPDGRGTQPQPRPQMAPASINNGVTDLSLGVHERSVGPDASGSEQLGAAPSPKPPGLIDLSSVEWCYLDPQGNVQGPFTADIMQRWQNEGYFASELMMKRRHLDTEWTSVGEMTRRAGTKPIFLTPGVTSAAPPGLRRPDVLAEGPSLDRSSPLQPVPTVSRRGSTLDPYLHNGSSASSPSSSFGGGRYLNGSPDPSSLDGRTSTSLYGEPAVGSRLAALASMPSLHSQRRPTLNDPFDSSAGLRHSFSHTGLGRGLDTQVLNGMNGFGSSTSAQFGQYATGFDGPRTDLGTTGLGMYGSSHGLAGLRSAQDMPLGQADQSSMQDLRIPPTPSRVVHRDMYGKPVEDTQSSSFGVAPLNINDIPYSPSSIPYSSSQDNRSLHSHTHTPLLERPPVPPIATFGSNQQSHGAFVSSPVRAAAAPQWPPQPAPATRRPVGNTVITGMSTTSATSYPRSVQHIPSNVQSPWGPAIQQGRPVNGWGKDASSLTQHDVPSQTTRVSGHRVPEVPPAIEPSRSQKPQRKSSTQAAAPSTIVPKTAPPSPSPAPAAWATDEEAKKVKPSGAPLAETKKLEARKAAERERERAARLAGASWGLPTSQAGAARPVATPKEPVTSPGSSATTPATAVWTNTANPEIQEEEEKRRKLASKEKETVAAAAKRAHADATTKVAAAATPAAVRPTVTTTTSAKVVSGASSPAVAPPTVAVRVTATPAIPPPRPAMTTKASSRDFMKWMGDSLKGLNSSVSFEEITSMLLSFPLDPDPSTVEIISDLIYASSTTLDGRRFAAEFVSRRKADAATRAKNGTPAGSSAKGVSIADVVKAQPKQTQQPEWGGFKVVNKKKKGGRA
ncbi:uncharacterized protein B0H18DRAFT_1086113 [Fomitopsis serialis]|uniref:uncharacterized protein n=1 Tax=Fomitopsis serialis TaxID=139415 RepID=UPI0020077DDA|nr:uncharacterized protein B0H18DRAFT_1086113 [Neoantrodia serialis]KAH9921405.1 hypothetical protein B0H18DRAFT_1086113 [Neoantrodia serialis]